MLTPAERGKEAVEEEPLTADTTAVTDTSVLLRVERVEERACDQVGGPDCIHGSRRRVNIR